eukprot:COSAG06_NODE_62_length_27058_cov_17.867725_3_plen_51_part_00
MRTAVVLLVCVMRSAVEWTVCARKAEVVGNYIDVSIISLVKHSHVKCNGS